MGYIESKANEIVDYYLSDGISNVDKILSIVDADTSQIYDDADTLNYLTIVTEANNKEYEKHLKECTNKDGCGTNQEHKKLAYFLKQELSSLGISVNSDAFSYEEKQDVQDKLDLIIQELKDVKDGHQIIYDDLMDEISELKKWFIIGKKNWKQLASAKFGEIVASGIISEAISKPLLEFCSDLPKLINQ